MMWTMPIGLPWFWAVYAFGMQFKMHPTVFSVYVCTNVGRVTGRKKYLVSVKQLKNRAAKALSTPSPLRYINPLRPGYMPLLPPHTPPPPPLSQPCFRAWCGPNDSVIEGDWQDHQVFAIEIESCWKRQHMYKMYYCHRDELMGFAKEGLHTL